MEHAMTIGIAAHAATRIIMLALLNLIRALDR